MIVGTDIHIRVERKNEQGVWEVVKPGQQPCPYSDNGATHEDWPTPRNCLFFALVANARNGFGFAGVPTHEPITPIAEPRGLPTDMAFPFDADEAFEKYEDADAARVAWLGDHSHTWLLLSELQAGMQTALPGHRTGIVELPILAKLDNPQAQPESWSGDISSPRLIRLPFDLAWEMSRIPAVVEAAAKSGLLIVTRHPWTIDSFEGIDEAYRRLIFEEWPKLGKPEDVRIIMGFDS